jgi:hypothetical protein
MCFSAEASFGAGTVLCGFGIAAVLKAKTREQKIFALTPLIFAFQQFGEGMIWLSLNHPEFLSWHKPATYLFLFISQVTWPVWVPLIVMLLEKEKQRTIALSVLFGIGVFISTFFFYNILFYKQDSNISGMHVQYTSDFYVGVLTDHVFPVLYVVCTVVPLFLSSFKRVKILGAMVFLFSIIAYVFYKNYEISTWCFFSALMSAMVCGIIYDLVDSENKKIVVVTSEVKEITLEKPDETKAV